MEQELIEIAGLSVLPIIAFKSGDTNWVMDKFIDVGINNAKAVKQNLSTKKKFLINTLVLYSKVSYFSIVKNNYQALL